MAAVILLVEDEAILARNLQRYLVTRGHEAATTDSLARGLAAYAELKPDIVVVDFNLPDGNGLELIRQVRGQDRRTKIVMMTAHGSVETAVEAMKLGADDYLAKPVALEELALLVDRLMEQMRLEGSLSYFTEREQRAGSIEGLIGESPPMRTLKQRIEQLLTMEARVSDGPPPPVLILGETGTGKELIARALHRGGTRKGEPFIEINCAALPENLVESELFGHERGAFTDARERRPGLFVAADRGTLFLDEVGELPLATQAKLLKVLEERVVRAVGSVRDRKVNVRLVAATNAALEDKVASGEFRGDLFFRLGVVTIHAPPLRQRGDDIVLLAEHFLADLRRRYGRAGLRLDEAARAALARHRWPGNVRELRNVIEQSVLLTVGETIGPGDLSLREPSLLNRASPAAATSPSGPSAAPPPATLAEVERDLIVRALAQHRGNVTLAARELGISRDTLRYRLDKHALKRGDYAG